MANDQVPDCHNSMGVVLCALGRLEQAIAHYKKALALDPEHAETYSNLGNALNRLGIVDEAKTFSIAPCCLNQVWRKPKITWAMFCEMKVGWTKRSYISKCVGCQCAIRRCVQQSWRGVYQLGKLEDAIAQFQLALALKPSHAEGHNNLGNAFRTQGKLAEAITHHRRALALNPNYAQAYRNLADALQALGSSDEAVVQYRRGSRSIRRMPRLTTISATPLKRWASSMRRSPNMNVR